MLEEGLARTAPAKESSVDQELQSAFNQVRRDENGERGAVAYSLDNAVAAARVGLRRMEETGVIPKGDGSLKQDQLFANGLLKERLEQLTPELRSAMLRHASSEQLRDFLAGESPLRISTGKTDAAIREEISARKERLENSFNAQSARLTTLPTSPAAALGDYARAAINLAQTARELQEHRQVFAFDDAATAPALANVQKKLAESQIADTAALDNLTLGAFAKAAKTFAASGLQAQLGSAIDARIKTAEQPFVASITRLVDVAKGNDYAAIIDQIDLVTRAGDDALVVANDLGKGINDADKIAAYRHRVMNQTLTQLPRAALEEAFAHTHNAQQPASANQRTPSGEFAAAVDLFINAGSSLFGNPPGVEIELGKEIYNAGVFMSRLDVELSLALFPDKPVEENLPGKTVPSEALAALRSRFGLEANLDQSKFSVVGSTLPPAPHNLLDAHSSSLRLLDALAKPGENLSQLEESFILGHLFAAEGVSKAEQIAHFTQLLASSNDVQINRLLAKTSAPSLRNLIDGIGLMAAENRRDTPPGARLERLQRGVAVIDTLDEALRAEAARRDLAPANETPAIALRQPEQISAKNQDLTASAQNAVERLDLVRPSAQNGVRFGDELQAAIAAEFTSEPVGTQKTEHQLSITNENGEKSSVGTGVVVAFNADIGRSQLYFQQNGVRREAFDTQGFNVLPPGQAGSSARRGASWAARRLRRQCQSRARTIALP